MSPRVPKTAMVFAAGLGTRMRPVTDTLPKPLVKVRGRALIDYWLDRLAEDGVERAIVNVHGLPTRSRRISPAAGAEDHHLGRTVEAARPGRRNQARAADDRRRSVLHLQHRRVLDRGPALKSARLAPTFDPETMDILLLVAASAGAVGVDWPGDFVMTMRDA